MYTDNLFFWRGGALLRLIKCLRPLCVFVLQTAFTPQCTLLQWNDHINDLITWWITVLYHLQWQMCRVGRKWKKMWQTSQRWHCHMSKWKAFFYPNINPSEPHFSKSDSHRNKIAVPVVCRDTPREGVKCLSRLMETLCCQFYCREAAIKHEWRC